MQIEDPLLPKFDRFREMIEALCVGYGWTYNKTNYIFSFPRNADTSALIIDKGNNYPSTYRISVIDDSLYVELPIGKCRIIVIDKDYYPYIMLLENETGKILDFIARNT